MGLRFWGTPCMNTMDIILLLSPFELCILWARTGCNSSACPERQHVVHSQPAIKMCSLPSLTVSWEIFI